MEVKLKALREAVNEEYKRSHWGRKCHNCAHYDPSYSFCNERQHLVSPNHSCEFHKPLKKKKRWTEKTMEYHDTSSDAYLFGEEAGK